MFIDVLMKELGCTDVVVGSHEDDNSFQVTLYWNDREYEFQLISLNDPYLTVKSLRQGGEL